MLGYFKKFIFFKAYLKYILLNSDLEAIFEMKMMLCRGKNVKFVIFSLDLNKVIAHALIFYYSFFNITFIRNDVLSIIDTSKKYHFEKKNTFFQEYYLEVFLVLLKYLLLNRNFGNFHK